MSDDNGSIQSSFEGPQSGRIRLDSRVYSSDAILRTAYWYTAVAHIQLVQPTDSFYELQFQLKTVLPTLENPRVPEIQEFIAEFCNMLLDFELRGRIDKETSGIRSILLAKAFSESGILEDPPPGDASDPVQRQNPQPLVKLVGASK